MAAAIRVATLPLRRRRLGLVVIAAGTALAGAGILSNVAAPPAAAPVPTAAEAPGLLQQVLGREASIVALLGHTFNQSISTGGLGKTVADLALRAGAFVVVLGFALVILAAAAGPLRGFVGMASGVGLIGCAIIAGVLSGENARLQGIPNLATVTAANLSTGWWLCVAGFAVCAVGGALAALRPLAGIVSAVTLALSGVAAAVVIAIVVGADRLLTAPPTLTGLLR